MLKNKRDTWPKTPKNRSKMASHQHLQHKLQVQVLHVASWVPDGGFKNAGFYVFVEVKILVNPAANQNSIQKTKIRGKVKYKF